MRSALLAVSALALSLLAGCPSQPVAVDGGVTAAVPASATGPASCGPGAYTHTAPDFCFELPPDLRGKAPTPVEGGLTWHGVYIQWEARGSARAVAWQKPGPSPQHKGKFEVWSEAPSAGGSYFQVFDATQHEFNEIYKVPRVAGVAVVTGQAFTVRCEGFVNVERDGDARALAEKNAALLGACKTLRVR